MNSKFSRTSFCRVLAMNACLISFTTNTHAATCLRGVNIAGAEFGDELGGYGEAYIYPSDETLEWAASEGMTAIRLPFKWERLQPALFGSFDSRELEFLKDIVAKSNALGLTVILDPHNYAEYRGTRIGNGQVNAAAFADFWQRLAPQFSGNSEVVYLLMNEPAGLTAATWFPAAQAGIHAIRDAGANNLIMVPGTIWTGASHWFDEQDGGSNADLFENIEDPLDNMAFEVHQYMDEDYSGTNSTCPRSNDAIEALQDMAAWLKTHDFKGFVGEFGGTTSPDCLVGLSDMAAYLNSDSETWIGWSAWAAGEWWGDYELSLQPIDGSNTPQMKVLAPHLNDSSNQCG
ncbi:MAG: glycoside hydrolase family 5 protein [Roseibium sp.]